MDEGAGERDTDMGTLLMLGFSTQHPTVSCGTERPHLPPLGPAGVTISSPGMAIVTKPRFRPSVSTAKSRYFNNLRLPHQTHTPKDIGVRHTPDIFGDVVVYLFVIKASHPTVPARLIGIDLGARRRVIG